MEFWPDFFYRRQNIILSRLKWTAQRCSLKMFDWTKMKIMKIMQVLLKNLIFMVGQAVF